MLWTECKQMYMSGLRVYLRDSYNWIDFIVLSLYLASYVLRLLVSHRVHQADMFYDCITARSRDALAVRDFRLYDVIVNETFGNRSSTIFNYFMKACEKMFCLPLIYGVQRWWNVLKDGAVATCSCVIDFRTDIFTCVQQ